MANTPTPKGSATRERMLEASIELMRGGGLAGAGINEIVKASGAPKGSVYHFFPGGKQQLVDEALQDYARHVHDFMRDAMRSAQTPGARVRALFAAFARRLEQGQFRRSCAFGAVCLDLDDEFEGIRATIEATFSVWIALIAAELGIADRRRARSLAGVLLSAIEGAYIRGRAERSGQPFVEAGRWLAALVEQEARGDAGGVTPRAGRG